MDLVQCEYLPLPSRASSGVNNIYSYSSMTRHQSSNPVAQSDQILLMMATDRAVFVVSPHCQKSSSHKLFEGKSRYGVEELPLSLPRDAQIISFTSMIRRSGVPLLALTFCLQSSSSSSSGLTTSSMNNSSASSTVRYALHIYGSRCTSSSLTDVARDCQSIELGYIPFLLSHTSVLHDRFDDVLVSGSDGNVHVFRQSNDPGVFHELIGTKHPLPELTHLPSSVLSLDLGFDVRNARRVVAAGCQDGLVRLSSSPTTHIGIGSNEALYSEHYIDGPAVSVRFFSDSIMHSPLSSSSTTGAFVSSLADDELARLQHRAQSALSIPPSDLHLLVGGALGFGAVYDNVLNDGLDNDTFLPHSDISDSVLCTHTADIDLDGRPELMLGTHGLSLMVFGSDGNGGAATTDTIHDAAHVERKERHPAPVGHTLISHHSFAHPVYALDNQAISGEGVDELVVTTMFGMTIMQWSWTALERCVSLKSDLIADIAQLEATLAARQPHVTVPVVITNNGGSSMMDAMTATNVTSSVTSSTASMHGTTNNNGDGTTVVTLEPSTSAAAAASTTAVGPADNNTEIAPINIGSIDNIGNISTGQMSNNNGEFDEAVLLSPLSAARAVAAATGHTITSSPAAAAAAAPSTSATTITSQTSQQHHQHGSQSSHHHRGAGKRRKPKRK